MGTGLVAFDRHGTPRFRQARDSSLSTGTGLVAFDRHETRHIRYVMLVDEKRTE